MTDLQQSNLSHRQLPPQLRESSAVYNVCVSGGGEEYKVVSVYCISLSA